MSETFSLGCEDCKEHIWCAQKSHNDLRLYTRDDLASALASFLFKHRGHRLVFDDNTGSMRFYDWAEVGPLSEDDEEELELRRSADGANRPGGNPVIEEQT